MSGTHRKLGVITGFSQVTAESPEEGAIPIQDNEYTLADLYVELSKLRGLFDPEKLKYIEKLIVEHVNDYDNPHETDLNKMNTSVEQELYNLWLEQGHTGTREDFLKVIFQYVKIASLSVTLLGQSLDQVPSVYGTAQVIKKHNEDLNAHAVIFENLFPGQEMIDAPTLSMDASVGLSAFAEVKRASTLSYIDEHGFLQEALEDVLPMDYLHGDPMFPIFGQITNLFKHSEEFTQPYWAVENASISEHPNLYGPRRPGMVQELVETGSQDQREHLLYPTEPITVHTGEVVTLSLFVKPNGRHCFGIRIPDTYFGPYAYVHFDLDRQKIFINQGANTSKIHGAMHQLGCGYFKIVASFEVRADGELTPEMYLLDIYDGDANYRGIDGLGMFIFGAMCHIGESEAPYIHSTDTQGILAPTSIKIPTGSWYEPLRGTFTIECLNIPKFKLAESRNLFVISRDSSVGPMVVRIPPTHNSRFYSVFQDSSNVGIGYMWSTAHTDDMVELVLSYSEAHIQLNDSTGTYQEKDLSGIINPDVDTLNLGHDRYSAAHFNSWIKKLTYYPVQCTQRNTEYFLGD